MAASALASPSLPRSFTVPAHLSDALDGSHKKGNDTVGFRDRPMNGSRMAL